MPTLSICRTLKPEGTNQAPACPLQGFPFASHALCLQGTRASGPVSLVSACDSRGPASPGWHLRPSRPSTSMVLSEASTEASRQSSRASRLQIQKSGTRDLVSFCMQETGFRPSPTECCAVAGGLRSLKNRPAMRAALAHATLYTAQKFRTRARTAARPRSDPAPSPPRRRRVRRRQSRWCRWVPTSRRPVGWP